MRRQSRLFFPVVAAGLLGAVAWWSFDDGERSKPTESPISEPRAEYYLKSFTLRATDETGSPAYRLKGPSMAYYRGKDIWQVQQPVWAFHTDQGDTWEGRADQGTMQGEGERARLQGDVRLVNPEGDNRQQEFRTDTLTLFPDQQYAETSAPVTVLDGTSRVDAVGAHMWLREERVKFLSNVEGQYVPLQSNP